jgi:hypothetical protein
MLSGKCGTAFSALRISCRFAPLAEIPQGSARKVGLPLESQFFAQPRRSN